MQGSPECWYLAWTSRPKKNKNPLHSLTLHATFWGTGFKKKLYTGQQKLPSLKNAQQVYLICYLPQIVMDLANLCWKTIFSIYLAECFVFHQHTGDSNILLVHLSISFWLVPIDLTHEMANELSYFSNFYLVFQDSNLFFFFHLL